MLMLFTVSWNQPVVDAKSMCQHQCVHRVFLIRDFIWDFWLWGFRMTKGSCQGNFFNLLWILDRLITDKILASIQWKCHRATLSQRKSHLYQWYIKNQLSYWVWKVKPYGNALNLAPPSGSNTSIWQQPYIPWYHRGLALGLYTTDFFYILMTCTLKNTKEN